MTDYVTISKADIWALQRYAGDSYDGDRHNDYLVEDMEGKAILLDDLRALLDKAPSVEPSAKVLFIRDEDGELDPHTFYSNDEAPKQSELKERFVIMDVWISSPQAEARIAELTKEIEQLKNKPKLSDSEKTELHLYQKYC